VKTISQTGYEFSPSLFTVLSTVKTRLLVAVIAIYRAGLISSTIDITDNATLS
jgi:hypothetical protein